MKKLLTLALLTGIGILVGCSKNPVGEKIYFKEGHGRLLFRVAQVPANVESIEAVITNFNTSAETTVDLTSETSVILPAGTYDVEITAYDLNPNPVYRGSGSFDVFENQTTPVNIAMDPVTGTVSFGLSWN